MIDAVRRLESIRANSTDGAQTGATHGDRFPPPPALDSKPPFDLKAAVSQVAMRRHELEARGDSGGKGPTMPDSANGRLRRQPARASLAMRNPGQLDVSQRAAEDGSDAPPRADAGVASHSLAQLLLDDVRALGAQTR